jgi:signal transduction histidine kinase
MPTSKTVADVAFKVSPQLIEPLGLEQLPDPALAVLELIKNSWDAEATRVYVEVDQRGSKPEITVRDNGFGMTRNDFATKWLVIGASDKRGRARGRRPLIGEKGLGRLASYALGSKLTLKSAAAGQYGFIAKVDWISFFRSPSVEDYKIPVKRLTLPRGTTVVIGGLRNRWTDRHTEFLATYTRFLVSVPGEDFKVTFKVDGKTQSVSDPAEAISTLAEARIEMQIGADGTPQITQCLVGEDDYSNIHFRNFKPGSRDPRLAGTRLSIELFLRDKVARQLREALKSRDVEGFLEKYQGIRIYRDGINVPPYGIDANDWAGLEKQRTSTGGPTMVPGNSQLIGELRTPAASHLKITAGRSGFADQDAVSTLAEYVRWTVRQIGTARRAQALGIASGTVPARVDSSDTKSEMNKQREARKALAELSRNATVTSHPELRERFQQARSDIEAVLDKNEMTLRLYAQLASTGIAATSFAHELRTDFDVVTAAIRQIARKRLLKDQELSGLLTGSWARIKNFVELFRLLPVKVRRTRNELHQKELRASVDGVFKLVPGDLITAESSVPNLTVSMVPAELDSVLLNLVSNSVKAIAESERAKTGRIRVQLSARASDLIVAVADNGCGIEEGLKSVIFEPLEGKFAEGTGMGLAIVRFIAELYRGSVAVVTSTSKAFVTEIRVVFKGVVR